MKIRVEINETETKNKTNKLRHPRISESKSWFFERLSNK